MLRRLASLLIGSVLLLVPRTAAEASTALGSLDCDRPDASLWRDSVGPVMGQGSGENYSFTAGGLCYSRLTGGIRSQPIRLAAGVGPDGHTGIPLTATQPEVAFDVSTNVRPSEGAGSSQFVYVLLRKEYASRTSIASEYRARITFSSSTSAGRNVRLKLSKVVSSVETSIGTECFVPWTVARFEPNRVIHVKVALTGASPTVLQAKVWGEGRDEPSDWQVTATDAEPVLQDAGQIQLLTKVSSSNVALPMDYMFDNFAFADAS